jgi:stage II sporulation protein D
MSAGIGTGRLKIALFVVVLLFISSLWAGIDSTEADAGGTEIRVRVLEGRIEGCAALSSSGNLSVSIGGRKITAPDGRLNVTAADGGGLEIGIGEKKYTAPGGLEIGPEDGKTIAIAFDRGKTKTHGHSYSYRGRLRLYNDGGAVAVINIVPVEDYLYSVVASEISSREAEAVKAQAILSRTYVMVNLGRHGKYDFCDKTHCQHYGGAGVETAPSIRAVDETRGLILLFDGRPALVFYHACCGGTTTTPARVWGGEDPPYLKPVVCGLPGLGGPLCSGGVHFRWEAKIEVAGMHRLLSEAFNVKARGLRIVARDPSGRAEKIEITGPETRVITGEEFRIAIGRALGWSTIKSTLFEMDRTGGHYVFRGRGLGHGVGMCQEGAMALSRLGFSHEEILEFYFPGTEVGGAEDR